MSIPQKLKDLPDLPGVYIMRAESGQVLYIGKAKNLKKRVSQYFRQGLTRDAKLIALVSRIVDFSYIIANSELDALILENNLIKEHKPPYNILLKDDKAYPFIRINLNDPYPRLDVVRKLKQDGAKYFGPYMLGITTRDIFELISAAFKVRQCKHSFARLPKSHRACLNFHIKQCLAPCTSQCSQAEYMSEIKRVVGFLSGNDKEAELSLKEKMAKAAEREDYENALHYREMLAILEKLVRKQVTALPRDLDMDIFAVAGSGLNTVISMLFVRGGKLIGGDKKQVSDLSLDKNQALSQYIAQHYSTTNMTTNELVVAEALEDQESLQKYLSELVGKKVNIITPHQGVRRQLADMALANANDFLEKSLSVEARQENLTMGAVFQLAEVLKLKKLPIKMECFDISNIQGTDSVASMTVFVNGEKQPKLYRRFKIKTVEGANDFESMKEVVSRRLARYHEGEDESFATLPDLLVVDGGKGQLSFASQALKNAQVDIELISLAEREEEIFVPNNPHPIVLSKDSYALKLLQRLRDEAHRFALNYHQTLRAKRTFKSELDNIEGLGAKKITALFAHFKTIHKIKSATVKELQKAKGIGKKHAESIVNYFSSNNSGKES